MIVFPVSFLMHTLRGKAFENEEQSKVTLYNNLYRCSERTAVGASSSGRAFAISLSKQSVLVQKGSLRNEGNFSAVGSTASVRLLPDQTC